MNKCCQTPFLTLLRHAHTKHNGPPKRFQGRLDVSLSAKGIAQTEAKKSEFNWVKTIIASPARRVQQTIQTLFQDREELPPITLDANLWEIDNGWFSGKLVDEVRAIDADHLQTWFDHPAEINPGDGENLNDMRSRALKALRAIDPDQIENTLIVTHGGILRVLMLTLAKRPLNDFHLLNVENLHQLRISQDELTTLCALEANPK